MNVSGLQLSNQEPIPIFLLALTDGRVEREHLICLPLVVPGTLWLCDAHDHVTTCIVDVCVGALAVL